MNYTIQILEIENFDKEIEIIQIPIEKQEIFQNYIKELRLFLQSFVSHIDGLEFKKEKSEILKSLVHKNKFYEKFAKIFELKKISHLLNIVGFCLAYAREYNTLTSNSMDYILKLIIRTSIRMIDEIEKSNSISEDLSSIIDESKIYLKKILLEWNEKKNHSNVLSNIEPLIEESILVQIEKKQLFKKI